VNLLDQPPEIREGLAAFEGFRRLGFDADQIELLLSGNSVLARVSWRGETFAVRLGSTEMSWGEFRRRWLEVAEALPSLPENDLQRNWHESLFRSKAEHLLATLAKHGIFWPSHPKFALMN